METGLGGVHLLDSIFGGVGNMVQEIGVYVRDTIDSRKLMI